MKMYQAISTCIDLLDRHHGLDRCDKWEDMLKKLESMLPSGSGIDAGTKIDRLKSSPDKLVLHVGYHHINDVGYYTHWTQHKIVVTPSLRWGFSVKIGGPNHNCIKAYLEDVYGEALNEDISPETLR
jgi:hypothetical protein